MAPVDAPSPSSSSSSSSSPHSRQPTPSSSKEDGERVKDNKESKHASSDEAESEEVPKEVKGKDKTDENDDPKSEEDEDEDKEEDDDKKSPKSSDANPIDGGGDVAEQPHDQQQQQHLPVIANAHVNGDWQAIWSPQHNMYYFYNTRTNETTWTNPLANSDTSASTSTSTSSTSTYYDAAAAAAIAQGIDPSLAYLDPSLAAGPSASSLLSSNPAAYTYSAKFNSRTGAFTRPDGRDPEHVSEYERMKRMNNFYFDMDQWQKDVDDRNTEEAEGGKKRKKPSKKDLVSVFVKLCFLVLVPLPLPLHSYTFIHTSYLIRYRVSSNIVLPHHPFFLSFFLECCNGNNVLIN